MPSLDNLEQQTMLSLRPRNLGPELGWVAGFLIEECVVSCELFGDSEFSDGRQGVPKGCHERG